MFANIPLKILRPSVWLPLCICAWGTVMTLQGIVQNYGGLVTTRFLLGTREPSGPSIGALAKLTDTFVCQG